MIRDNGYKKKYTPPERHSLKGDLNDKSLYVLSLIGEGSAADIAGKLAELESIENVASLEEQIEETLSVILEKGMIKGYLSGQVMVYNLINSDL